MIGEGSGGWLALAGGAGGLAALLLWLSKKVRVRLRLVVETRDE